MSYFLLAFVLFSCTEICYSFLANDANGPESKTHEFITRYGIYGAAAKYIKLRNLVTGIFATDYESIKVYFSSDSDGLEKFERVIDDIVKSNNDVQRDGAAKAEITFNGEQIREGHNRLLYLKRLIEHEAKADSPVVATIRELIGQYLYTLQSFYSNTNWIEMRGDTVYFDLGQKDATIMDIAFPNENTCKNSYSGQKHLGYCPNNIILENKLTSGYKSGQDIEKPDSSHNDKGKCSHGGPKDTTISTTANCGINKETSNSNSSPHNHLHEDAAKAAIKATEHFISDNGTGLISDFTDRLFQEVFSLKKWSPKSLSYVIDVSGSMGNDIASVKSVTTLMLTNRLNRPADYVLATFNDPESLTYGYVTEDISDMINEIAHLTASGGDDCPEYALSGIEKAIFLSRYQSDLYVFTDASAKDADKANEVIRLAIDKKIRIEFLLTGSCSERKRRSKELSTGDAIRHKRQSGFGSVFESIAHATGGSVQSISSSDLSAVLETLLEDLFPNISITFNQVYIDYIRRSENSSVLLQFYVDNGLTELQIQLTGVQTLSNIYITYPNGDLVNYTSNNNTWQKISFDTIDIIIPVPLPGQWSIVPNVSREIYANISGQGSIDFTFKIMKQGEDGYLYEISGNPIAGETYKLIIKLTGDVEQVSLSSLDIIDLNGTGISVYTLASFSSLNDSRYKADITMPSMKFVLKVSGSDGNSNILTRIKWFIINPVQVQLTLVPVHDELLINQGHELHYQIKNLGDMSESFLATITDNHGFPLPPTERNHTIAAGNTIQDIFIFRPTVNPLIAITYTIEIRRSESTEILQAISKNVYVTSIQHPKCNIVYVDGSCPLAEVTPTNCSLYKWFAMTETNYSSIAISSVVLSNTDSKTQLSTGNISSLHGPLATNVSGTCCIDIVDLHVTDTDGYLATCKLNFRYKGPDPTIVNVVSDSKNETTKGDTSKMVEIALGISATVLVVAIAILIKFIVSHIGSSAKVKDLSINVRHQKQRTQLNSVKLIQVKQMEN